MCKLYSITANQFAVQTGWPYNNPLILWRLERTFLTEQSNGSLSPRTIWLLIAVALAAMIGVFASMATSLAIRDLQASQHQVIDQLKALQEAVSSDRADMKRLSDEVAALNATGARQQIPPTSAPAPTPTGQKRGTR